MLCCSCLGVRYMSGASWRRTERRGESPAQALPPPKAPLGLLRCREPFSFHCTVGPPDTAVLCALGTPRTPPPPPCCFFFHSFELFPGFSHCPSLCLTSSFPHLPLFSPLFFSWGIPSQQGGHRLGTESF